MRTKTRVALAALAAGALTIGTVAPAGAQDEEPEALGFAVTATEGQPGKLVSGQVDTADVAEHCVTDLEEFRDRIRELFDGPFGGISGEGPLLEIFFPDFEPGGDVPSLESLDQHAFVLTHFVLLGLRGRRAEDALPQTFVMTFADIATQEPVGERDTFDPEVGEASVVVPDVEPGLWALAAACVGPSFDIDVLEAGIRESGDFLEEIGYPNTPELLGPEAFDFMEDFTGKTGHQALVAFLTEIGPTLLEPIMVPDALGAVLFCVLDEQGNCPADEPPAPPPGEPAPPPTEEPAPAQPVVAAPTFTG